MNKTFGKLNQINVNEDTEKKGRFTYLSWSHAWKYVQKNSENASFELLEDIVYPDGTREVRCSVTIDGATHTMWLAVTDNNNRAIKNPDARAVGDSRMRCLEGCLRSKCTNVWSTAATMLSASGAAMTVPLIPSRITASATPTLVAATGVPQAKASRTTRPKLS